MEGKIQLTLRTATRDRQATIAAPADATVGELLASARDNWALSGNYEYVMRCERLGSQLAENTTLASSGIQDGDVLEVQPLADAG